MKNKFKSLFYIYIFISSLITSNLHSIEIFNFNVTEIEVSKNGTLFKTSNGGEVLTNDGIKILAENFEYDKSKLILTASQDVEFIDKEKNIIIKAEKITYFKNKENIIAEGYVEVNDTENNLTLNSNKLSYSKNEEKIIADENVLLNDFKNNVIINSKKIIYFKNINKFYSEGNTTAKIQTKYTFEGSDIFFFKNEMRLQSSKKTQIIDDNNTKYTLGSFNYQINDEFLKATKIEIIENFNLSNNTTNKYYFEDGFFDLKQKNFKTGLAKIHLKKNTFDRPENDPRLYGVSSNHKDNITTVEKAVFTSCKKNNDECPPWQLEASEIKHDKIKRQLIYKDTVLKVYDIPVFYFPKFFHPDPTVNRQSGFLTPKLNNSNILGTSISVPYFGAISDNRDFTFNPIFFSKNVKLFQNEFRQENKNSSFIADFAYINGFKSTSTKKKSSINHLFAKFTKNLELDNFLRSDIDIFLERVNKDTYLKIFSNSINESRIKPNNNDVLKSGFNFFIENKDYQFNGGTEIYEDLTKSQNDRYQFVLPYFNYSHSPLEKNYGKINLSSVGSNILDNTNNVRTKIVNNLSFNLNENILENIGLKNSLNFYFKNLNSLGKNVSTYKTSPQIELQSLIELNSELPMIKNTNDRSNTLIPRLSLRINPGDMKNHSSLERKINTRNIFDINRLGLTDSLESGNSLTIGLNLDSQKNTNSNNSYNIKLASVFRDESEKNIPSQTTLDKKNSNLFGSFEYKLNETVNLDYNFALDNKMDEFEYNSIGLNLSLNNFITEFNFIKEDNDLGNTNIFENVTKFNFNEKNSLSFKTRRNREINLTEYYNLVYEYKNDCLTAGVKFNKTYYEDRDLKPSENIMFSISFYPLTTIEQSYK